LSQFGIVIWLEEWDYCVDVSGVFSVWSCTFVYDIKRRDIYNTKCT